MASQREILAQFHEFISSGCKTLDERFFPLQYKLPEALCSTLQGIQTAPCSRQRTPCRRPEAHLRSKCTQNLDWSKSSHCPFDWSRPRSRLWVLKLPIYNFLMLLMYCCYYLCLRKWDPLSGTASSLRAFTGNHLEALVLSDLGKEGHWFL